MRTSIELTSRCIRLARSDGLRIVQLESYPVAPGSDPIDALAHAPLPKTLGPVRVLLHHDDLLIRPLTQPAMDPERLGRLVRAELGDLAGSDDPAGSMAVSWRMLPVGDGPDLRLIAIIARRRLLGRLRRALERHEATLDGLTHPGVGLHHRRGIDPAMVVPPGAVVDRSAPVAAAPSAEHAPVSGSAEATVGAAVPAAPTPDLPLALVDIGGAVVHLALVQGPHLLLARSHRPGIDDLMTKAAEQLGGDPNATARALAQGLMADELAGLVGSAAGAIAMGLTAANRYVATNLGLPGFAPVALVVSGGGATAQALRQALAERARLPVISANPFAELSTTISASRLDLLAALPSPWTAVLGVATADTLALDVVEDERSARRTWWLTDGIIRVAAVASVVLALGLALVAELAWRQVHAARVATEATVAQLTAEAKRRDAALARMAIDGGTVRWLDGERRVDRITDELLAAAAKLQDPRSCPVVVTGLSVRRVDRATQVDLTAQAGSGSGDGASTPEDAARTFANGLRRRYPPIASIDLQPFTVVKDKLAVGWRIGIPDR